MKSLLVLAATLLLTVFPLSAQFVLPGFPTGSNIELVGSARLEATGIEMNPLVDSGTASAVWYRLRQRVDRGFTTTFSFRISDLGGKPDSTGKNGGDGLSFTLQNFDPKALGKGGGHLGYSWIEKSVAVEFDTYKNTDIEIGDPDANHLGVHTQGGRANDADERFSIGTTSKIPNLSDGRIHKVRITYLPGVLPNIGSMAIYMDTILAPVLVVNLDLRLLLQLPNNGVTWIGFTAGTEDAWERHTLLDWCFAPTTAGCGCDYGDTVVVRETIVRHDTVTHRDTVHIRNDSLIVPDTVRIIERVYDTTRIVIRDTVVRTVTEPVYIHDTITVVRIDTFRVVERMRDTVVVIVRDTLLVRDTIHVDGSIHRDNLDSICGGKYRTMVPIDFLLGLVSIEPNPAGAHLKIIYDVGDDASHYVALFDLDGKEVMRLHEGAREPGRHTILLDISTVSTGTYYLVLQGEWERRSARVEVRR